MVVDLSAHSVPISEVPDGGVFEIDGQVCIKVMEPEKPLFRLTVNLETGRKVLIGETVTVTPLPASRLLTGGGSNA